MHHTKIGHHIGGFAGLQHRYRNHARVDRLFVARDDGLKALHQLAGNRYRVYAVVGQGGVAALAVDGNFEFIARGHDRPRADRKRADFAAGPVVHAEHGFHGELREQALFHHFARAAAAFFSGLEDGVHGAVKVAPRGE